MCIRDSSEILSFLKFGWSWLEILYKRRQGLKPNTPRGSSRFEDNKIGWAGWGIRAQETLYKWEFSEQDQGELMGMWQWAPPTYNINLIPVSYTHLRAHETRHDLVCRLLLEKK